MYTSFPGVGSMVILNSRRGKVVVVEDAVVVDATLLLPLLALAADVPLAEDGS